MYKKIYDISLPYYPEMPVFPGDPHFYKTKICSLDKGDIANISTLTMSSHTGTHIDAPSHFFAEGLTVDQIPLEDIIGTARVIELDTETCIMPVHLEDKGIREGDRILLKTPNSRFISEADFRKRSTYLSPQSAQFLADKQVRLVGIDYFSIDSFSAVDCPSHKILLKKNILVLENLNLIDIKEGEYFFIALPLKIIDCDGCPVRAILLK